MSEQKKAVDEFAKLFTRYYDAFQAAQERIANLELELDFLKSDPATQYTVQMYSELSDANKKLIDDLMNALATIKNNKDAK